MDTDGSASLEDGRMPHDSPGDFGEELGESKGQTPWPAPPEVTIEDRDIAVKNHDHILSKDRRERPLILYTDGSGMEGRIGAAVVDLQNHRTHSQMGDDTSTVYAAGLRGIEMALNLTLDSTSPWVTQAKNGLVIFADSQAVLKALRQPRMPSGQVYLEGCLDLIWRPQATASEQSSGGYLLTKEWLAMNLSTNTQRRRPWNRKNRRNQTIGISVSQLRLNAVFAARRKPSGLHHGSQENKPATKRLIELPTKKTLEYWSDLRKATASILMQLRTGSIGLAAYLHRINRRESARCSCDLGNQTASHILLEYPLLQDERNWMRNDLSDRGVAVRLDSLLARPEARAIVAEFMIRTNILEQFQAVDLMALGVKEGDEK